MKLNDLKIKYEEAEIAGQTFKLALNMNVLANIEEIYGNVNIAIEEFRHKPIKSLRNWIYAMLKDQIEDLTIESAGELASGPYISDLTSKIGKLLNEAFPSENKKVIIKVSENNIEAEGNCSDKVKGKALKQCLSLAKKNV